MTPGPIVATDRFYSHDAVVYAPTSPLGVVEMRRIGDIVELKRFVHSPSDFMHPSETTLVATVRVPRDALLELLKL